MLTPREKGELERIADNDTLLIAIRKVVLSSVKSELIPNDIDSKSNLLIGQKVRAYYTAIKLMDKSLINLKGFIKKGQAGNRPNPAR